MSTLSVVATPIGNLKDVTLRALEVLKSVDIVFAEDTRVTKKLLAHFRIRKPVERCDAKREEVASRRAVSMLREGAHVAFVVDAGTPGISDPGARLVASVRAHVPQAKIEVIPGPSSLTAALSVSGVSVARFTFLGYPPHKKGRQKFFLELAALKVRPIALFESPHRLQKTLADLAAAVGMTHHIVICKELTKRYEEVFTGTLAEAQACFMDDKGRGEFVLVVP